MTDYAFFCASCGAATVDVEQLAGTASCRSCNWQGNDSDLIVAPIEHNLGSHENIIQEVVRDLQLALAKDCAQPLGRFLLKWGFLQATETPQGVVINTAQLTRYMVAIQNAVYTAVIQERELMEKEQVTGG